MSAEPIVRRIADGVYRVDVEGCGHVVHVAGASGNRWVHWNGQVFHNPFEDVGHGVVRRARADQPQALSAPMPATVLKVLVEPGGAVKKGDTLIILEAMKMELPIRSATDTVVRAVRCREGELVPAGAVLVELE